jgi:hypothetical protein
MRKLLLLAGLFSLGYLITPIVFGQPSKELTPDDFKQEVARLNAATQGKLDATLTKLLGTTQSASTAAPSMPAPSPQSENAAPATAPADTGTSFENNAPITPGGPGLNMYQP